MFAHTILVRLLSDQSLVGMLGQVKIQNCMQNTSLTKKHVDVVNGTQQVINVFPKSTR